MSARVRPGAALVAVIVALVLVGALVAGTFTLSLVERHAGHDVLASEGAFAAAEWALEDEVARWSDATHPPRVPVGTVASPRGLEVEGDSVRLTVTRLADDTWWILADARARGDARAVARQRIGLLVHPRAPGVHPRAALLVAGDASLGDSAHVSGFDASDSATVLREWVPCPPADTALAGVVAGGTLSGTSQVSGRPPVRALPLDSAGYVAPDDSVWGAIVARADETLPAGASVLPLPRETGGACDEAPDAWGEPWRGAGTGSACAERFPIVHAAGDLRVRAGGRGQGILVVDGDLIVEGDFEFYGLVLVRGALVTGTGRVRIAGAVIAGSARLGVDGVPTAPQSFAFSRCALARALRAAATMQPVPRRGWAQLF